MARWVFAALALLATGALTACGVQTGSSSKTASSPGATQKTITLGATRIEPDDLTMASTDVLTFMNTAVDPLQVEFIKPPSQAGKIGCHVADPKSVTPGETPWATFSQNAEGHFAAMVPPGRFPSVCTLAPGPYTYVVKRLSANPGPSDEFLGQEGNITVR